MINDMLDGTYNGIYGWPGQTVQIPTNAGTAAEIALPAPTTPVSPFDVLINQRGPEFRHKCVRQRRTNMGFALVYLHSGSGLGLHSV